jgi:hypothetical protein
MSIEDMFTENVMSYMATDIIPMHSVDDIPSADQVIFTRGIFSNQEIGEAISNRQNTILSQLADLNRRLASDVYELNKTDPSKADELELALKTEIRYYQKLLLQLQDPSLNAVPVAFRLGDDVGRAYLNLYSRQSPAITVVKALDDIEKQIRKIDGHPH